MSFQITDPFFRQLYKKLAEELESRINALASGSAISHGDEGHVDAIATAMRYRADTSYIQALQEVIGLGKQIDHQVHGGPRIDEDYGDE